MADGPLDTDLQDELVLRMWDGDESVKGELIVAYAGKVEASIRNLFPTLTETEAEDVVAEAIRRFWHWRDKYDPARAKIQTVLYRFARNAASEYRCGRYRWQKIRFQQVDDPIEFINGVEDSETSNSNTQDPPEPDPRLRKAVKAAFDSLSELQRDILQAYADAGEYELDAAVLGRELGFKHKDGVPIPATTIRVYKKRAKDSMKQKLAREGYDLKTMGYTDE